MADTGSQMLKDLYAGWIAANEADPERTLDAIRADFEHWGDVTTEPGQVDYIEGTVSGVPGLWAIPKRQDNACVLLCAHGGGYVLGSMYSHRKLYGHLAKAVGCKAFIPDYRRAPEHVHPAQVNDVVAVYAGLLADHGATAERTAFVGDSAGGALAISGLLAVRERGLALPAAAYAMAPYLDLEARGATYETNAEVDILGSRDATLAFVDIFLGPDGNRHDPLASPLHADLAGLPPILIQTGADDVLLDDSRAFYERATNAGNDATLKIWPDMQHVFQFLAGNSPVADTAIAEAAVWLREKLGIVAK
ncbi:MAG: alpha/beta hydrolase [Novosphingobium sp.]